MKRNLVKLENEEFDVLVIGGGIYGVATAREAALSGLKVALIDRGDFGAATSANSLKIIHGGLRYLQHADFRRMRRSIAARSILLRIAPHLVHPLKFVMPVYGHLLRGREAMAVALSMNNLFSWDRNYKLSDTQHIQSGRSVSKSECLKYLPGFDEEGLSGGAIWYDCIASNTERLTLEFVIAADGYGARVANYVEAIKLLINSGTAIGIQARDCLTGEDFFIRSKIIVNATGPRMNKLLNLLPAKFDTRNDWAKAVNIYIKKSLFRNYAVGFECLEGFKNPDSLIKKGKRLFFCVPWQQGTLIGTTYKRYSKEPASFRIQEHDIYELINEINHGYPPADLTLDDVAFCHGGLVPVIKDIGASVRNVQLVKRSTIYDHQQDLKVNGLITINGVKYTTALVLAKDAVDLIYQKMGFSKAPKTGNPPLPGAEKIYNVGSNSAQTRNKSLISSDTVTHLKGIYGSRVRKILKIVENDGSLSEQISEHHPTIKAEIFHAINEEMAQYLTDVVMRRTGLGGSGNPGLSTIEGCAAIMGQMLKWGKQQQQAEVSKVISKFEFH